MNNDNLISALRNMADDIGNIGASPFTVDLILIQQAIAALEPQWQPIETAPKDGTRILIGGGSFSYGDYGPYSFNEAGIAQWYRDHWRGEDCQAHDQWYEHEPTHWQPLPAAPEVGS